MKASILGTEYEIKIASTGEDDFFEENPEVDGYCDSSSKTIGVKSVESVVEYQISKGYFPLDNPHKNMIDTIRHEVIHAFMSESGLDSQSTIWAHDEQLIDWLVQMIPKIEKVMGDWSDEEWKNY